MALFIDYRAQLPSKGTVLCIAWCKIDSVLAVSCDDNAVYFISEEGDLLEESTLKRDGFNCIAMDWRLTSRVVSCGYDDGTVCLWSVQNCVAKKDAEVHKEAITYMGWSPDGGRLLTGDRAGVCAVWKTDHRSRLTKLFRIEAGNSPISTCEWKITPDFREKQRDMPTPPSSFFLGTCSGLLLCVDAKNGTVLSTSQETTEVAHIMWYEEKQRVVLLTNECTMAQYDAEHDDTLNLLSRVKLSMTAAAVKGGVKSVLWTGPGLLATAASEQMVRFWDLLHNENYMITLSAPEHSAMKGDVVTRMSFNSRKRILVAGTREGKLLMWRFVGDMDNTSEAGIRPPSTQSDWDAVSSFSADSEAVDVQWGPGESMLAVAMSGAASIFNETVLHRKLRNDVAAMQVSADRVLIQRGASIRIDQRVGVRIKGIDVNDTHMVVWNRKKAEVYEFRNDLMDLVHSFPTKAESIALHGQNLFQAAGSSLEVCNLQGVSKKSISFTEQEGRPKILDINNKYLALATSRGMIKLYDVSRREPKPLGSGTRFAQAGQRQLIGEIRSVRCNSEGTRVSVLSDLARGAFLCEPDTRLHIWDADRDIIQAYEFGPKRFPRSHFWEGSESKLLACEAQLTARSSLKDNANSSGPSDATGENTSAGRGGGRIRSAQVEVVTLFATDEEGGIMMQDSFALDRGLEALLGLKIPRLFFISKPSDAEGGLSTGIPKLKSRTMRDFVGLSAQQIDDETKRALVNFSYYLTIRNMDEAYKAVKLIQNVAVWENMANMCVKTKRLDVAEVCLGNMGHARGAAALREAKKEPEDEARIAASAQSASLCWFTCCMACSTITTHLLRCTPLQAVAVQLGRLEDAERLYIECGRFDLLNQVLQASGQWDKALEVAVSEDRINLRTTHFKYAQYLETVGDTAAAIKNYEASETHRQQVPRMLFSQQRFEDLEAYIQSACDEELTPWWGKYCESCGEFDRAIHLYTRAADELSLVRVHCHLGNFAAAADVALGSANPAASYHLAQTCEQKGDVKEAIQFYSRAGRYNHAVRLAKEHGKLKRIYRSAKHACFYCVIQSVTLVARILAGLDNEMVNLALRASPAIMVDAARYLEAHNQPDKAVLLYQKAGYVPQALDLCFRAQLFDRLREIADDLSSEDNPLIAQQSSPEILARCADFFIDHGQYEKAVQLYITGKEPVVCFAHTSSVLKGLMGPIFVGPFSPFTVVCFVTLLCRFDKALDLCMAHKVQITEAMAERITLDKMGSGVKAAGKAVAMKLKVSKKGSIGGMAAAADAVKAAEHNKRRQELLEKLAKCCKKQGNYHLATKKYTQAGDKLRAMKCLLKSGDTEKIIFFAGVSRNREIYILAANYLQNLDWHNDPEIMKAIISFYTKAKAFTQLSGFYDACAQVEIDEYRDYEKALGALKEAVKYMMKAKQPDKDDALNMLQQRISLIERFVQARKMDVERAIRVGDVFALLIEFYYERRDYEHAHQLIEKMRARNIILSPYLDQEMTAKIYASVGQEYVRDELHGAGGGRPVEEGDDDIDDDIDEDIDEDFSHGK